MTEEERAALYRQLAQAREQAALARWNARAGSRTAYANLVAATEALEYDDGWDPVEYLTEDERDALGN